MKQTVSLLAAMLLYTGGVPGQTPAPDTSQPAPAAKLPDDPQELVAHLLEAGVRVDRAAKSVTIDAIINAAADPLEYLLIHQRGRTHEALFVTEVQPSMLNTAMLLVGLEPGANARMEPIDPPPSEAEIEAGADVARVVPPAGMEVAIQVAWSDEEGGAEHSLAAHELILDLSTREPVGPVTWHYLGGRMAPLYRGEDPVFVADYEGNLVSICYLGPEQPNHLATMRHERARDDQNWWVSKACPPPGTAVQLQFRRVEPKAAEQR
ncbi:MAG: YdjY domain-containing protein [Planctomycetota bacterium]